MATTLNVGDLEPVVAAAAAGDSTAFARIVDATSGLVTSIALAIVRDVDVSQEIAQDVFMSAWRDLRKLRNPASLLPWLRQMTRNRAHHVLRGRVRARRWMIQPEGSEVEAIVDGRAGADEQLIAAEERDVLRQALAQLPDETREVLALYYREGQSVAQVALLLELNEDTVKKRLSRARSALRATFLERLGDTLRATAPGATFTAAIVGSLPVAAPLAASAATASSLKVASTSGGAFAMIGGWLLWLVMPILAILLTASGALVGIVLEGRARLRKSLDEQERRELRRFQAATILVILIAAMVFQLGSEATTSRWLPVLNFAAFLLTMALFHHVWLPRILKRRFEAELRANPAVALVRRRRERRNATIGWTVGLILGWLGLILGLIY
jgi:RNA polymerase sigma factor (sigma-70 family)